MHRSLLRRGALVGLALPAALMAGCESESTTGPRIVSLSVVSGFGQTGFIGAELPEPFVVRVADQNDEPAPGVTVTWEIVSGGGVVTPEESVTDANGHAVTFFRLGPVVGTQTVRATLGFALPVTISAIGVPLPEI